LKKNLLNKSVKIKKIVSAASTLTDYDKRVLINNNINLFEMYGAAEIGTVTSINFKKNKNLIGSVGKTLKNIDIKIINEKNKFLEHGSIGEIVCKTPLRFKYYYDNIKLTKDSFVGEYFKTGDLGKQDRNKNLFFLSRKQDVIISSGKNIYPIDIEKELLGLKIL
jgi:Acyl-CoA synthetases (AMP-forming)/AMP-acid ligases II